MTEKKKYDRHTIARLFKYLWSFKGMVIAALILTVFSNVLLLWGPRLSGQAIDRIGTVPGQVDFEGVFRIIGRMLMIYAAGGISAYGVQAILIRISQNVARKMRAEVFNHLMTLPVSSFDKTTPGEIISRISYDIDTINTSLSSDVITLLTSAISVFGSFYMMMRIAPVMCLFFIVTVPLILFFTRFRAKVVRPLFSLRSRKLGELNGFTEEMLSGYKTIKAYGQEDVILERFDQKNDEAVGAYYEADYQGSIAGPSIMFINNLTLVLISVFGSYLYLKGRITIGNISSFVLYSRRFAGPINETANIMAELQSALSASERVFHLLDEPSEIADAPDAEVLEQVNGDVVADHVNFSYVPDKQILFDLSFHANPGKMIAIVGPTGAGKTTIINLLMRFYDADTGEIRVDEHPVKMVTRDSLRKQYAMILQDTWLFSGTVAENISYGREGITREDVIRAAKAAHIHSFIESLPQGYDTVLTDDGSSISKGQKQLLTIARAMLSEAKMLILDEATSNVDSRTEMMIQEAMLKLCEGKTSFVIAHRLSTIQNADWILVLKNGRIIEQGTHESLLKDKGFYAGLFNAQFEE